MTVVRARTYVPADEGWEVKTVEGSTVGSDVAEHGNLFWSGTALGFADKGYDAHQAIRVELSSATSITGISIAVGNANTTALLVFAKNGNNWHPVGLIDGTTDLSDQWATVEFGYRIVAEEVTIIEMSGSLSGTAINDIILHDDPSVAGLGTINGVETVDSAGTNFGSAATSHTLAWPSTEDGDVMVLMGNTWSSTNNIDFGSMTDWVEGWNDNDGNANSILGYYVCDGTESGNITIEMDASSVLGLTWYLLRGVDNATPIEDYDTSATGVSLTGRDGNRWDEDGWPTDTTHTAGALIIDYLGGNLNFNIHYPEYECGPFVWPSDAPTSQGLLDGANVGHGNLRQWDSYQCVAAYVSDTTSTVAGRKVWYTADNKDAVWSTTAFKYDGSHSYELDLSPAHTDEAYSAGTVDYQWTGDVAVHTHDFRSPHDYDLFSTNPPDADDALVALILSEDDDTYTNPVLDGFTLKDESMKAWNDTMAVETRTADGSEDDDWTVEYNSGSTLTGRRNSAIQVLSLQTWDSTAASDGVWYWEGARIHAVYGSDYGGGYMYWRPIQVNPGDLEIIMIGNDASSTTDGAITDVEGDGWSAGPTWDDPGVGGTGSGLIIYKVHSAVGLSDPWSDLTMSHYNDTGDQVTITTRILVPAQEGAGGGGGAAAGLFGDALQSWIVANETVTSQELVGMLNELNGTTAIGEDQARRTYQGLE